MGRGWGGRGKQLSASRHQALPLNYVGSVIFLHVCAPNSYLSCNERVGPANADHLCQNYLGAIEECGLLGLTQAAGAQESGIQNALRTTALAV